LARGDSDLASSPGLFATLVGLVVIATLAAIALAAAYWLPRAKR
jgi:hypothetical protein